MSDGKTPLENGEVGNSPPPKKGKKWAWVIGAVVVLLIAISSCSKDSTNTSQQANQTSGTSLNGSNSDRQKKDEPPAYTVNMQGVGKLQGIILSAVGMQDNRDLLSGMLLELAEEYDQVLVFTTVGDVQPVNPDLPGVKMFWVAK
ncbi:MAG: hypothetical protein PHO01_11060 [Desulfotomaculaceae bacterium]|nr:hypothetical protein [Desulfotomaculaceae bacterium]